MTVKSSSLWGFAAFGRLSEMSNTSESAQESPIETSDRSRVSLLLTDLARFTERTYGRTRMQEAWAEFNRWKTPPSSALWSHAEFFHVWLFWDWTPDANDASLDASIAKEHAPAEQYLATQVARIDAPARSFLQQASRTRLSFHQGNLMNGKMHLRNLLTQENTACPGSDIREGEIRFGMLVHAAGSDGHPWTIFAPETLAIETAPTIRSYRQALLADSQSEITPELLRAYAVETFDLYINLRQEPMQAEASP